MDLRCVWECRFERIECFDGLEWGKFRNQKLNLDFGCINYVNIYLYSFPEMWRTGRGAGLEVGVGTQDLSLRCLLNIQVEMTKRFVMNLDSREKFGLGIET